jgi:hypothetical protein
MYAMVCTRPDIAYAVSKVAQHVDRPSPALWTAIKHILMYLQATKDLCLKYSVVQDPAVYGFCDSDWGGDELTRKSTSGYVFIMSGAAVSWSSKKQSSVALSSTEAEYMACTQASKEAVWLRQLLHELHIEQSSVRIFCDSQGSLALLRNPVYHARTKHIDVQYHYVRELVELGILDFAYVRTDDQAADILTKPLPRDKIVRCRTMLGVCT